MSATDTEQAPTATDDRPVADHIPPLPTDGLLSNARHEVETTLSNFAASAEDRARIASELAAQADAAADAARIKRDAAIHTLSVHYKLPHGSRLHEAAGMPRTTLAQVRRRMQAVNPPPVKNPEHQLTAAASETVFQSECATVARKQRNAAVLELVAAGWSNSRIGTLIGRDQSGVARIKTDAK